MTDSVRPGLMRPLAPCPVCGVAVAGGGRCEEHRLPSWSSTTTSRQERGYGRKWDHARRAALRRDHHRCVVCGAAANEVDHIVALADGGSHALMNLRTLCPEHHKAVTADARRRAASRRR